jgi:hypothetical protein
MNLNTPPESESSPQYFDLEVCGMLQEVVADVDPGDLDFVTPEYLAGVMALNIWKNPGVAVRRSDVDNVFLGLMAVSALNSQKNPTAAAYARRVAYVVKEDRNSLTDQLPD